jgi:hypothetical protein
MCRFGGVDEVAREEARVSELYVNFDKLMMSKLRRVEN